MAAISKDDIGILTEQVLLKRRDILEMLDRDHIEIDASYLNVNLLPKLEDKLKKITEPNLGEPADEFGITLEDMEGIIAQYDILEKKLTEKKPLPTSSNVQNMPVARKEQQGVRRFGSMTDVNKTLSRTLSGSTLNLNSTNMFAEPQAPAPKPAANCNQPVEPKVTSDQIAAHNALKADLQSLLNATQPEKMQFSPLLDDIRQKYLTSFDRLNKFFNEIQQINLARSVESENDTTLKDLDQDLLDSMDKLSKALGEVLFMAKNKQLYNADAIKSIDSTLSDDLTDILDQFFRTN